MKIAICTDYFHPKIGGITTHVENLARNLEKRGYEVVIITKKAKFDDNVHGLNVRRIKPIFNSSQTLDIPHTSELEKIFREIKPDVIHAHHAFSPISLFSLSVGKSLGIKTILTNHSIQFLYDLDYVWRPSSYVLFPYRSYIKNADRVIAVSKASKTFISHFTNKEVKVIPNGINVSEFAPPVKEFDGKNILFVGRFAYRKGLHLLLAAMQQVVKENKEAKLTIAGTGYLNYIIRTLVELTDLQKNICIEKNVDKRRLIELYQKSNVFVMPTLFGESFGIVLLEAMASKTPIVATRQGGIKEIIAHGKTGLLVEKNKVRGLAENIITLLNDKTLSEKISSNAYKEVKKYDWSKVTKDIESVYKGT